MRESKFKLVAIITGFTVPAMTNNIVKLGIAQITPIGYQLNPNPSVTPRKTFAKVSNSDGIQELKAQRKKEDPMIKSLMKSLVFFSVMFLNANVAIGQTATLDYLRSECMKSNDIRCWNAYNEQFRTYRDQKSSAAGNPGTYASFYSGYAKARDQKRRENIVRMQENIAICGSVSCR